MAFIETVNGMVWGIPMLVLILGTGIYLTLILRGHSLRKIFMAFGLLFKSDSNSNIKASVQGEISPFRALMTSLSATVGTGNIAGVGLAIAIGGPGALFWMWITALVGMATKYAEAVLAVRFREKDGDRYLGGPMYYIRLGLGEKWAWLAFVFAGFTLVAGFGIGNTVQANSVAEALKGSFNIPPMVTAGVLAAMVAAVLIGGLKRISAFASWLMPAMALLYVLAAVCVIALNISQLPAVFVLIVQSAFSGSAAVGGFAGAGILMAIRHGVARGIFSNEAGLGSAPIAHAAAETSHPAKQGFIAMLGTFIDTIIICSLTGIAILITGVWSSGEKGASLTSSAFAQALPFGAELVAICLALFAFSTLLGWSYYGERALEYLAGKSMLWVFRTCWVLAIPLGATMDLGVVWLVADTLNAMMALPNIIALILLSPVVWRLTQSYLADNSSSGDAAKNPWEIR